MKNKNFLKGVIATSISIDRDKHYWRNKMYAKTRYEEEENNQPDICTV